MMTYFPYPTDLKSVLGKASLPFLLLSLFLLLISPSPSSALNDNPNNARGFSSESVFYPSQNENINIVAAPAFMEIVP